MQEEQQQEEGHDGTQQLIKSIQVFRRSDISQKNHRTCIIYGGLGINSDILSFAFVARKHWLTLV